MSIGCGSLALPLHQRHYVPQGDAASPSLHLPCTLPTAFFTSLASHACGLPSDHTAAPQLLGWSRLSKHSHGIAITRQNCRSQRLRGGCRSRPTSLAASQGPVLVTYWAMAVLIMWRLL